jgi:hypothetical protein
MTAMRELFQPVNWQEINKTDPAEFPFAGQSIFLALRFSYSSMHPPFFSSHPSFLISAFPGLQHIPLFLRDISRSTFRSALS